MAFFIAIVVLNFVLIIYCSIKTVFILIIVIFCFILLGYINFGSQDKAFLRSSILVFLLMAVFLFFLLSFYRKLEVTRARSCEFKDV